MRLAARYIKSGMQISLGSAPWVLCFLIFFLLLAGCGEDEIKIRVGVSISGIAHPDSRLIKLALDENAADYGTQIAYEQEGLIELLAEGINVLILSHPNLRNLEYSIKEAHRENIPVIILDCPPPQSLHAEAYVKVNHFDAGKMAADYVVKELGGKGNVIVLEGPRNDEVSRQITLGMYNVLEQNESIRIVASEPHQDWSEELAADTVRTTVEKYAGNIQAVLAGNSQLAMGAAKTVSELRLADRIVTAGIGADLAACRAIIAGTHDAEVDRDTYRRGLETLILAKAVAEGKDFVYDVEIRDDEPKIKVRYGPLRLITKENVSVMNRTWPELAGQD